MIGGPSTFYQHAIVILENGYEEEYKYVAQYLSEEPFPQEVATEVRDILRMFQEMQWALENFPQDPIRNNSNLLFDGFDGNSDFQHIGYARFLHSLDQYPELNDRLLYNSHTSSSLLKYRAMVEAWKGLPRHGLQMTKDDLQTILDAPRVRRNDKK